MADENCLFCERALGGNRAKEHVVPAWLLKYLSVESQIVIPAVARMEDSEIIERRRHTADALLEGRICNDCNGGWMSRLEVAAKPLIIALIEGERLVFGLTDDERLLLARWSAKTAYMMNSSSNLRERIDSAHLRGIMTDADRLPTNVAVFFQQHGLKEGHTRHFAWVQQNHWPYVPLVPPLDDEENKGQGGYKIGLQFGQLVLLTVFWPHAGWKYVIGSGMHAPLWPVEATSFAYTINDTIPVNDSALWLMAFTRLLAVVELPR